MRSNRPHAKFQFPAYGLVATLALSPMLAASALAYGQESAPEAARETPVAQLGVMHLSEAKMKEFSDEFRSLPEAFIDPDITTYPAAMNPSLLDRITYNPAERNQKQCADCFTWAMTALIEIMHSVQTGVNDRLSTQWFDSNLFGYTPPGSSSSFKNACVGGNIAGVLKVYYEKGMPFVPWSNKNAEFQDGSYNGNNNSPPAVAASAISTIPSYWSPKNSIEDTYITTTGVSQATAIDNIKNTLLQNKGVGYGYYAANSGGMAAFQNWWNTAAETAVFDPDTYCGESLARGLDGHETTIVGYDASDSNPDNHYWLVLNSWGTTTGRPNGLFRLKMNMNYGCKEGTDNNARTFETLQKSGTTAPFNDTNSMYLAAADAADNGLIETRKYDFDNSEWGSWTSSGRDASSNPVLVTYNTRQYNFYQAGYSIYMRSMGANDSWSAWTELPSKVNPTLAPAAVVFQNNLYLFANKNPINSSTSPIEYMVMSDNGTWSSWQTVPYSGTGHSPAAVVYDGQLNLFETNGSGQPAFAALNGAGQWNGWWVLNWNNVTTDAAPAVAAWDGSLWLTIKEKGTETIQIAKSTGNPEGASWSGWSAVPGNGHTAHGPAIAGISPSEMCLAITGQTSTTLYLQCYSTGLGWLGWNSSDFGGLGSDLTPSINTYWFQ